MLLQLTVKNMMSILKNRNVSRQNVSVSIDGQTSVECTLVGWLVVGLSPIVFLWELDYIWNALRRGLSKGS